MLDKKGIIFERYPTFNQAGYGISAGKDTQTQSKTFLFKIRINHFELSCKITETRPVTKTLVVPFNKSPEVLASTAQSDSVSLFKASMVVELGRRAVETFLGNNSSL